MQINLIVVPCFQADLLRSCETGCRLLSIIDAISIGDRTGSEEGAAATSINNCNRSCDASYPKDIEVATACKQGCLYQVRMALNKDVRAATFDGAVMKITTTTRTLFIPIHVALFLQGS